MKLEWIGCVWWGEVENNTEHVGQVFLLLPQPMRCRRICEWKLLEDFWGCNFPPENAGTFNVYVWFRTNLFLWNRYETCFVFNTYLFGLKTLCQALHIWRWCCRANSPGLEMARLSPLGCPLHRWTADERVVYPKSIVTSVFSASQLPSCQQGAWKLQVSFCFPHFVPQTWYLGSAVQGSRLSLQMQLPAQKPRNQLKWDLSCHKGPGCLKNSPLKLAGFTGCLLLIWKPGMG